MKWFSLLVATTLLTSCASHIADKNCALEAAEIEVLKDRVLSFLESKWQPKGAKCEEITDFTQHVRDFGCGIYGSPAGSSRPGCPDALDGDYFVIFDSETLVPNEVVLIAY